MKPATFSHLWLLQSLAPFIFLLKLFVFVQRQLFNTRLLTNSLDSFKTGLVVCFAEIKLQKLLIINGPFFGMVKKDMLSTTKVVNALSLLCRSLFSFVFLSVFIYPCRSVCFIYLCMYRQFSISSRDN